MRKIIKVQNKLAIYSVIFLCVYMFVFSYSTVLDITSENKNPRPFGVDFALYYAAGQMVINGQAADLYNVDIHHIQFEKVVNRTTPVYVPWLYPPTFLLLVVPFTYFPFYFALILWILITLSCAIYAVYLLVPKYKYIVFFICGFPGVLMNLRWGQNGFISTALIGLGLYFIERNPILSGAVFGFLTYKPQMAFFPLLLLLITKNWNVLFWSVMFSLFSALFSGILFGFNLWINFFDSFFQSSSILLTSVWENIVAVQPTLYSALRLLGIENQALLLLLGVIALLTTIACLWIWRKTERLALRGSALVLGILLTMPYYLQYDLMILSIPIILLSYDYLENGYRTCEVALLVALWFMPLINWPLVVFTKVQISPFVLIAALVMTIVRVKHENKNSKQYGKYQFLNK